MLASSVLGTTALRLAGDAATQRRLLPAVASGAAVLAFAHDEATAAPGALWVETQAALQDGQWRLSGRKCNVLHAASAQHLVVTARHGGAADDGHGLALFVVDTAAAGVRLRPHRLVDDTSAAELLMNAAAAWPLGDPRDAQRASNALQGTLNAGIAAACADMLGAMELAFELAIAYLNTRQQFGRSIGQNQALRHKAADMLVSLELCRSMAIAAAVAADRPGDTESAADLHRAKLVLGRHGRLVCQHAVQIHGGIGMTEDCAVGHALRRVHVLDQLFGDGVMHASRLAALG